MVYLKKYFNLVLGHYQLVCISVSECTHVIYVMIVSENKFC